MEPIQILETELKSAMLNSDVETLDKLLATDLIFTNHLGQIVSKAQDLELHRSKLLKISTMETMEERFILTEATAVVSVLLNLVGTYAGENASGKFRFTRVWAANAQHQWQVIASHSSLLAN